ncbi:MAG: hypothetical protein KC635_29795 [Myxococcales bacterium]|nr:hypothetical protein [Myxococcales bacterium]
MQHVQAQAQSSALAQARPAGGAAAVQAKADNGAHDALRGMSFDAGAAYLAPVQAKLAPGAPVQAKPAEGGAAAAAPVQRLAVQRKNTTKPTLDKLDAPTVAKVVAALKGQGVWAGAVSAYKAATQEGKAPLERAAEDDIFLELLVAVEAAYSFAEGVSIDTLLDDAQIRATFIGAVKKDATPAPAPAPEAEKPKVEIPRSGTFGMVTSDTELVKADGSKLALKAGDACESQGAGADGMLKVLVHSGKEVEGTIDPKLFKTQPRISTDDDGKTQAYTYQKYEGKAFLGEPSVMDVDQGALGDCYLISGMGAVAAANPEIIKKAVKDNGDGTYTITFYELQKDGKTFKPHTETVDSYLPSYQGQKRTTYAQSDTAFNPVSQALWPALIEKAYAQWQGGYTAIQKGGQSSKAMEAITGVKSVSSAMPKEEDVIATFAQWQKENKAVVCGTRDWIQQTSKTGLFEGAGGSFKGALTDEQGMAAEIVKGTVKVKDAAGKGGTATDDKKGKLAGASVDSGSIAYDTGKAALTYKKDLAPADAKDLEASYQFEGTLNQGLNIHGDHAYMFRGVQGETLLFHNPWGPAAHKHPKPMTAAQFREYFETIAVNATLPPKG